MALASITPAVVRGQSCQFRPDDKIMPTPPAFVTHYGNDVAADGDRMIVGAWFESIGKDVGVGAAYILTWNGNEWVHEAKLLANDAVALDHFGYSVDIDGDVAVVSAIGSDARGLESGAAYVFRRVGAEWIEEQKIAGARSGEKFGDDVAINGDVIVCGAPLNDELGWNVGAAHVFRYRNGKWQKEAQLNPSLVTGWANVGDAVATDGDFIYLGAPIYVDEDTRQRAVFAYQYIDDEWVEATPIWSPPDFPTANFGKALALDGDRILIGAIGSHIRAAAFIYKHEDGVWWNEAIFQPDGIEVQAMFGSSVALRGRFAVVGAPEYNGWYEDAGAAWLFERDGAWREAGTLIPDGIDNRALFGSSVAIARSGIVIGAPDDDEIDTGAGAIFHFNDSSCDLVLRAKMPCPRGGVLRISWTGATPTSDVVLLHANQRETGIIPKAYACAGTPIGLPTGAINFVLRINSDQNGAGVIRTLAPDEFCGGFLQVIDLATCATSNVAIIH